jgi:hypothetical protein
MSDPWIGAPDLKEFPNATKEQKNFLDNSVRNISAADLQTIGEAFGFPSAHLGDLTTTIHPILTPLVKTSYLDQPLRLASIFLTHFKFLPIWHAILFSSVSSDPHGAKVRTISTKPILSGADRKLTEAGLVAAAKHIKSISISGTRCPTRGEASNPWGVCHPVIGKMPGIVRHEDTPGEAAIDLWDGFAAHLDPAKEPSAEVRVRAGFGLAVTLIHEVAHALWICSHFVRRDVLPDDPERALLMESCGREDAKFERLLNRLEPFVDDQRMSELGFAVETWLFGGLIEFKKGFGRGEQGCVLTWEEWSEVDLTCAIKVAGLRPIFACREGPRLWISEYIVPFPWTQRFFERGFWEGEFKERWIEALVVPKVLGARRLNMYWEGADGEVEEGKTENERKRGMDGKGVVKPGVKDVGMWGKGREIHPGKLKPGEERQWRHMDMPVRKRDLKAAEKVENMKKKAEKSGSEHGMRGILAKLRQ